MKLDAYRLIIVIFFWGIIHFIIWSDLLCLIWLM
jgi:hypothetical protein